MLGPGISRSSGRASCSRIQYDRIRKVPRPLPDLPGSGEITAEHVSEAVTYRSLDRLG